MMYIKIHNSYRTVVAVCDSDLIGKIFEEGNIELNVKENFFKGEETSEDEVFEIMQNMALEDATFNIVGENSVNVAKKAGIISENDIKKTHKQSIKI